MGRRDQKPNREKRRARRIRERADVAAVRAAAALARPERTLVALAFGEHPDARLDLQWSGVRLPFQDDDPNPNAGLRELTALAAQTTDEPN